MMLSCRCFAHEEAGNYSVAEPADRTAIEVDRERVCARHPVPPQRRVGYAAAAVRYAH